MDKNMLEIIDKRISGQILSMQMEIERLKKTLEQKDKEEQELRKALTEKNSEMKSSQEVEVVKKINQAKQVMLRLVGVEGSKATQLIKEYSAAHNKDVLEIAELIIEGEKYLDNEYNIRLLHEAGRKRKKTRNRKKNQVEPFKKTQGKEYV